MWFICIMIPLLFLGTAMSAMQGMIAICAGTFALVVAAPVYGLRRDVKLGRASSPGESDEDDTGLPTPEPWASDPDHIARREARAHAAALAEALGSGNAGQGPVGGEGSRAGGPSNSTIDDESPPRN